MCDNNQQEQINTQVKVTNVLETAEETMDRAMEQIDYMQSLGVKEESDEAKLVRIVQRIMKGESITMAEFEFVQKMQNQLKEDSTKNKYVKGSNVEIPGNLFPTYEELCDMEFFELAKLYTRLGLYQNYFNGDKFAVYVYDMEKNKEQELQEYQNFCEWSKNESIIQSYSIMLQNDKMLKIQIKFVETVITDMQKVLLNILVKVFEVVNVLYRKRINDRNASVEPTTFKMFCEPDVYEDFFKPKGYLATYDPSTTVMMVTI